MFASLQKQTTELLAKRADEFLFETPPEEGKEAPALAATSSNQLLAEDLFKCMNEVYDAEEALDVYAKDGRVNALRECVAKIQTAVERNTKCKETMEELVTNYQSITERTSSLHHACDRIMANQTQLAAAAEQIKANLYYYTQCDWIMKKLTASRLPITGQAFTQIISTIHECICYLKEHPEHKEVVTYLGKYEQCLSKALTAIRIGIHSDIEASKQAVYSRQRDDSSGQRNGGGSFPFTSDDSHALLYGVFAARANNVRNALAVSDRFFSSYSEYQVMVNECEQDYFAVREELLTPVVQATVDQLVNAHGESSCTLTRSGCKFLLRLCDDEYRLYKQFFLLQRDNSEEGIQSESRASRRISTTSEVASTVMSNPEASPTSVVFTTFIENICKILYDVLRPLIIHNPHLETLAQLCTILKVEMIEDHCGVMMSMDAASPNAIDSSAGFVRVMSDLIGDIIMRIVYKASVFAETDILGYKPVSGDLNYPERLYQMRDIEMEQRKETDSNVDLTSPSAINAHCLWYPTVRRTIMCLSKLYKCLDVAVFQSIAKELLNACCDSLETAAVGIATRPADKSRLKTFSRALDAELFVVKHLLILREQTSPFRVSLPASKIQRMARMESQQLDAMPMVDYSFDLNKWKNSASQLFTENRDRWFELSSNNAFLEFIFSTPVQATESSIDPRRIVEVQLKKHCHQLIQLIVDMMTGSLKPMISAIFALGPDAPVDVLKDPILSPQSVQNASAVSFKVITKNWSEIRGSFDLYIGVRETEEILLHPVRKQVVDSYATLNVFLTKSYTEEQRQVAGVPSQEQVFLALNA